ncbi:GTPase Era [candidate division TA06 bacterium]|uniref:GTPase Era n=1 Tax=candidate division TA06 bacterium TaxID=2250710 RepID=A0A933MIJ4_UNCT6|nr:GTPase Era [candidate division TA06 bacterium]
MTFRSGYAALAGRPNVGKSTLLNALLGQKLAAVSRRPQTTRARVLGILNNDRYQIVLLDTPGLLDPRYAMQNALLKIAANSISQSDVLAFLVDSQKGWHDEDWKYLQKYQRKNTIVVLNKIDAKPKSEVLELIARVNQATGLDQIYPISALKKFGLKELEEGMAASLSEGQPFYPTDMVTDQPEKFFVAEIIREKIFELCGAEVPYATAVVIDEFKEQEGRKDVIKATIWAEKKSQKPILIGQGGHKMKAIGINARKEIEEFLDRPVFLELFVKVKDKWRNNEADIRELGLS